MLINRDTKLFGSFSNAPGNNGCKYFNERFKEEKKNAIYKSFFGTDPKAIIEAARTLSFSGFALSAPLKENALEYVDLVEDAAREIGAVNTVVRENGLLVGYNTDWKGVEKFFLEYGIKSVSILGTGGFSKAIQYCCRKLEMPFESMTREEIKRNTKTRFTVLNATPAELECEIDARPHTPFGYKIFYYQAQEQYNLYERII
jgi:shikimate 5-dehydrogenase